MRYILLVIFAFVTTFASAQVQFLGSPTTTVRNRGNFVSDSLFYLPKRQVAPTDTAAMRYAISDSSVYVWTGRAWRSIGRAGASFLSVSDTSSMLSPYIRAAGNGLTKSGQSLLVDTAAIATRARVQKAVDSINTNVALKVNISDTASMLTPYTLGSGTTNYLPKFTGSRTLGNSQIFDNGTIVGIGTASPVTNLHIYSASNSEVARLQYNGAAPYLSFWSSASRNGYIQFNNSTGALYINETNTPSIFYNNNLERMRITSDGNMGIGTSSADARLDVSNTLTSDYTSAARFRNTDAGAGNFRNVAIEFWDRYTTVNAAIVGARNTVSGNWQGDLIFKIAQGGSPSTDPATLTEIMRFDGQNKRIQFLPDGTERMRIKSDGELLIGTTTDAGAYPLQVAGGIYATQGTVLATVSGNVGIATTNPTYKLDVFSNARVQGSSTSPPTDSNSDLALTVGGYSGTTTGNGSLGIFGSARGVLTLGSNYSDGAINNGIIQFVSGVLSTTSMNSALVGRILSQQTTGTNTMGAHLIFETKQTSGSLAERMRIKDDGEVLIGTTTDAGAYALQVAGAQYVTGSGVFDPTATGSNYLYVGTTSVRSISGLATGAIQVVGNAGNTGGITIAGQLANNSNGDFLQFVKSRGTSNVAVQNGDQLGGIMWSGADGSNYIRAASIMAYVDAAPGTNDMPSRIEFRVTPDGSTVPTYRMALNNAGELIIQDNPTDAGNYKLQVDGAIYNTSTITTGAPTGGSIKPWRLGEAATVSPTSPNRTIRVEIDGTVYYIHAKTTND